MPPKLYMNDVSPAVRSVLMLKKALNIDLELHELDLAIGAHLKEDFLRINPHHTVPTLDDNGFIVWDSHAINAYLINTYADDKSLYPTDPKKRAIIDQRLHFDSGILFPKFSAITQSIVREGAKSISKEKAIALTTAYNLLETLLELSPYIAGNELSIADFSIVTTITTANVFVPLAENRFPHISKWLERMKTLPYYQETNQVGLDKFTMWMKSKLG